MRLSGCAALINLSCGCSTQETVNKTPCAQPIPVSLPRQCKWLFGKTQVASDIGPAASQSPVEKEAGRVKPREDRQVSEGLLHAPPTRLSRVVGQGPGSDSIARAPAPHLLTFFSNRHALSAHSPVGRAHRPRVISGQLCGGPCRQGGRGPRRLVPWPRGRGQGGATRPRQIWSLRRADVSEAMPWV